MTYCYIQWKSFFPIRILLHLSMSADKDMFIIFLWHLHFWVSFSSDSCFSSESFGQQGDQTSHELHESWSYRKSTPNIHQKDWCWSWSSNTLATWCKELTLWKRPWGWERLRAGGEENDREWDVLMASPTQWTWVWASSRNWLWTG